MKSKILLFLSILHSFIGFQMLSGMQEQGRVASLQKLSQDFIANYLLGPGFKSAIEEPAEVGKVFNTIPGEAYTRFGSLISRSMLSKCPEIRKFLCEHHNLSSTSLEHKCYAMEGLSVDGGKLATIYCSNQIIIWDLTRNKIEDVIKVNGPNGHMEKGIGQIELCNGILYILIKNTYRDDTLLRLNISNRQILPNITIDRCDLFATDGQLIAFSLNKRSNRDDVKCEVRFWNIKNGRFCNRNSLPFQVTALKFCGGNTLIAGTSNGDIVVWNIETGEILNYTKKCHSGEVRSIYLDKDKLVSTDGKGVYVWNLNLSNKSLQLIYRFRNNYTNGSRFVALNNNKIFLAEHGSKYVRCFDLDKCVEIDNALAEINDPLQVLLMKKIVDRITNGNEFQIKRYYPHDILFKRLPEAIRESLLNSKKVRFKTWG